MTRIHKTTHPPESVRRFFERTYPRGQGFTYQFYWYARSETKPKGQKIWGCFVYKNGQLYTYHHQAPAEEFERM